MNYDVFQYSDVESAQRLINENINDFNLELAFIYACECGDCNMVKMLIDRGANYWNIGIFWTFDKSVVELLICEGGSEISNELLCSTSITAGWNDLLVTVVYKINDCKSMLSNNNYDILEIFYVEQKESIVSLNVRLFDKNLFGV